MIFDRYLLKNLALATFLTAIALACIIMLTQSLRFLELVVNSGASGFSFIALTFLTLPRFFEVILPIALMIGTVFIYNKMTSDNEIVVMRASGLSPIRLSRPAFALSFFIAALIFFITSWAAPMALSKMQVMRVAIKTQFSSLLLREGVFNQIGNDLTVYIENRAPNGDLEGVLIHDTRDTLKPPITILAKRGLMISDNESQRVVVFEGSRQQFNVKSNGVDRLDFTRYSLDLPPSQPMGQRWREPDERTLFELFNPDTQVQSDEKQLREFKTEIHRRFAGPFLAISFTALSLCCLLLGDFNRRGPGYRIILATALMIAIQGLYLISQNLAKDNVLGIVMMYFIACAPMVVGYCLLSPQSGLFFLKNFLKNQKTGFKI